MTTSQADAASPLRLFFALWPDQAARKALARLALEVARDGHGNAPRESNLHLTLVFLGDVPRDRLNSLVALGEHVASRSQPFPLALQRIGGTSYRIAWIAPEKIAEPLHALQAALAQALAAEDFPRERRMFRPHVTLARECTRSTHHGSIPPIGWRVERLSLVASTLRHGGSEYREIDGWALGGSR
jgi:2'-5' RNA ligase